VKPGEIIVADAPAPCRPHPRTATIAIRNRGRLDAYLTSHFPVASASAVLDFDRRGLEGARPLLPAGGSVRLPAGELVEVRLTWT
jgi:urease beta subunit